MHNGLVYQDRTIGLVSENSLLGNSFFFSFEKSIVLPAFPSLTFVFPHTCVDLFSLCHKHAIMVQRFPMNYSIFHLIHSCSRYRIDQRILCVGLGVRHRPTISRGHYLRFSRAPNCGSGHRRTGTTTSQVFTLATLDWCVKRKKNG